MIGAYAVVAAFPLAIVGALVHTYISIRKEDEHG